MCKFEEYGNCDEETKNQEYCIFHKPNKSEEEAREFYEKFLKKFKPKKERIYIFGNEIERLVFEETVDCRRYVFPKIPWGFKLVFEYAKFKGDARFYGATFEGDARFSRAIFKRNVGFNEAIFKVAQFDGATFEGDARFSRAIFKVAQFDGAKFERNVWFYRAIFKGDARFYGAIFEEDAGFSGATFKGDARFSRATFEEVAWFDRAIFEKNVWFNGAIFKGDARFYGAIFEVARFDGATFKGDAEFIGTTFEGNTLFDGATFEGIADFREKEENSEYKFYCELSFSNAEFRKGAFIDVPSEWFKLPSAEAEACRVQRIFYEREGKKDDADRMFVRERRALRKAKVEEAKANVRKVKEEVKETNSSLRKVEKIKAELIKAFNLIKATSSYLLAKGSSSLEFLIADLTCEYGINWQRPVILWMFFVLFTFPLLYFILGGVTKVSSPLDYLYFSIVTATTLGYGDLQPIGWCKLVASTEAIFGTFMWAVFLAVFARKYMR